MNSRKIPGCPLEICDAQPEEISDVLDLFKGLITDYIRIGPKGYLAPKAFENQLSDIYNMPLRPSDIFVASYQRSGTTWTQELVWLVANNLDYQKAANELLTERYPFLDLFSFPNEVVMCHTSSIAICPNAIHHLVRHSELSIAQCIVKSLHMFMNESAKKMIMGMMANITDGLKLLKIFLTPATEMLASTSDPRFVKTHLPFSLLPPTLIDTAKIVYVARDPRDVAVSSYHHTKLFTIMGYTGDFKQFWNLFIEDKFTLTPYFEHVKEAWALRNHPNMLFLFYEDLTRDLTGSVQRVLRFFGKEFTPDQISGLCDHLSIEKFRNNKSVNFEELRHLGLLNSGEKFIRQGKAGGWRDYFDEEMTLQAERWISDNLRGTDLRFPSMIDIEIK